MTVAARAPLGVLGGMGPLASAEFLKTIYEVDVPGPEQNTPAVVLHSDPSMPDRTSAFLSGNASAVLDRFVPALEKLEREGVSKIVVCCITIHYLLPQLPATLRSRIVSLLDVIADTIGQTTDRHLLLCTTGTRQLRLFETHPRWPEMRDRLVMPDAADQQEIHRTIYQVKEGADVQVLVDLVTRLLEKYQVSSFVAGCTEIHFASKHFTGANGTAHRCVDPLLIIANDVARGQL
jgi:aspartate racemase